QPWHEGVEGGGIYSRSSDDSSANWRVNEPRCILNLSTRHWPSALRGSMSPIQNIPMDALRYPTGRFQRPSVPLTSDQRRSMIDIIARTPADLRAAVQGLSPKQLDTPYRPDGWTVRQVVHHVPDSHMNAYIRFRLALTEDQPTIKTYEQERWAELEDARTAPIDLSLALLESLHRRWVVLLRALPT